MSIKRKITLAFSGVTLLFIIATGINYTSQQHTYEHFIEITDEVTPSLLSLYQIDALSQRMRTQALSATRNSAAGIDNEMEVEDFNAAYNEAALLLTEFTHVSAADRNEVARALDRLNAAGQSMLVASDLASAQAALLLADAQFSALLAGITTKLVEEYTNDRDEIVEDSGISLAVGVITILIELLVVIALGVSLTRTITKPISKLAEGAYALSAGELGHTVDIKSQDEFAVLGVAFNTMSTQLLHTQKSLHDSNQQLQNTVYQLQDEVKQREEAQIQIQGEISQREAIQNELQALNISLEAQVKERTQSLADSLEQLNQQNRQLSQIHNFVKARLDELEQAAKRGSSTSNLMIHIEQVQSEYRRFSNDLQK